MIRANKIRGEVGFTVGERSIVLQPTFGRVAAIEARIGETLNSVFRRLRAEWAKPQGQNELRDAVTLFFSQAQVAAFLEEAGGLKHSEAVMLIEDYGPPVFTPHIIELIGNYMSGGRSAEDTGKNSEAPESQS